jgi:hypothetical protein
MRSVVAALFLFLSWLPPSAAQTFDIQGLRLGMTVEEVLNWGRANWPGKMSADERWDPKDRIAAEAYFHSQGVLYHRSTAITMYRKAMGLPLVRPDLVHSVYFIERSTVPEKFAEIVEPCEVSRGACIEVDFRSNGRAGIIESLQYLPGNLDKSTEDRLIAKYGKPTKASKAAGMKFFGWGSPGERRKDGGQARYYYPLEAQMFWIDERILLQVRMADRTPDDADGPPPSDGPRL